MKYINYLKYIFILLVIGLAMMIFFSPYGHHEGFDFKLVHTKMKINAPVSQIYNYLGNSENAQSWSVFVDHITPLNLDSYIDGTIGAKRRCFKNEDETGITWDEAILINDKNEKRRLNITNMKGFNLKANHLLTDQIYKDENGHCSLTFTLFYDPGKSNWIDELKLYYAAYYVEDLFIENLKNIKGLNETR